MTAASRIIGRIPIGDAENNNGAGELRFLECSNLKCARGLSLFSDSITLKMQNSRPWEKLAKVWSSIFEASHSYAALSIVASTRLLLSEIFGISYVNCTCKPINPDGRICATIGKYPIGLSDNDKHNSVSGSPERHRDDVVPHLGGRGSRARGKDHRGGLAPHGGQGHGRGVGGGGGRRGRRAGIPKGTAGQPCAHPPVQQ